MVKTGESRLYREKGQKFESKLFSLCCCRWSWADTTRGCFDGAGSERRMDGWAFHQKGLDKNFFTAIDKFPHPLPACLEGRGGKWVLERARERESNRGANNEYSLAGSCESPHWSEKVITRALWWRIIFGCLFYRLVLVHLLLSVYEMWVDARDSNPLPAFTANKSTNITSLIRHFFIKLKIYTLNGLCLLKVCEL